MKILSNKEYINLLNCQRLLEAHESSRSIERNILTRDVNDMKLEISRLKQSIEAYKEQEEYLLHFIGKNTKINKKTAELAEKYDLFEEECIYYFGKIRGKKLYAKRVLFNN